MLVLSLCLVGVQLGAFLILLVLCATKIRAASRIGESFLTAFYCVICLYVTLELAIQVYQLTLIIITSSPEDIVNVVVALNILCIVLDQLVLLMLTMYWAKV